MKKRVAISLAALLITYFAAVLVVPRIWTLQTVSGTVRDESNRPVADATVRIRATDISALTDSTGCFHLTTQTPRFRLRVTAWQDGYYVSGADAWPWDSTVEIGLSAYGDSDGADYHWVPPTVETRSPIKGGFIQIGLDIFDLVSFKNVLLPMADRMNLGCADCHRTVVDQWMGGAHALGARNIRFLTMYNGTDVNGERSPATRFGSSRDYGTFPLRPDRDEPYYGPGYKLDFPQTDGNCAACHLPTAAVEEAYGVDPNRVTGIDALGTHCDFCHKIASVRLDPSTGRPSQNMPGILSIGLMRPSEELQIFFGPYDDVDVGPDTYLPLMKDSEICAPCHDASFWGTPIYESFGEWLDSPYPDLGTTCQSCHMRPDSVTTNFAPGRGGVERDPKNIPTHHFPGGADTTLLRNAVTMEAGIARRDGQIVVTVTITNDKTGHHVPTDSPLRQMILLVKATEEHRRALPYLDGPMVPEWGGVGDPDEGYFAGQPGKGFAKILQELWTEVTPTGAYWNPTRIVSDNRIAAFATDSSRYVFGAPETGVVRVEATLLFRRAFIELMDQKGWDVPDVLMTRQILIVNDKQG